MTGFGNVNGQTVYAYAQDRSILGGSLGEAHARKICNISNPKPKRFIIKKV